MSSLPAGSQMLDAALGAFPLPAYTNDLEGFVTWQNAASRRVVGDLVGTHYTQVVPRDELPRSRETFAAVTLGGVTKRRIGLYRTEHGELVRLESILAPIRKDGDVVGTFGIAFTHDEPPTPEPAVHLSPRQLDVLRLLVQGRSTSQIALDLNLAPETVRNHVRRLLKALGARTRLEAALTALRQGLVSLDLD